MYLPMPFPAPDFGKIKHHSVHRGIDFIGGRTRTRTWDPLIKS
jgi:hypothetical protein